MSEMKYSESQVEQNVVTRSYTMLKYCRFKNFRDNFIFANCIKRHYSDVKNSRLRQDLPISINDRVILPFREGFIFTKLRMRSFAKIKSSRKFQNLQ